MKQLNKITFLGTTLLLSLLLFTGCTTNDKTTKTNQSTSETSQKAEEISVDIILINEEEELSKKVITLPTDSNLMTAVETNFEIESDGGMITSIDGLAQDPKESCYWTYMINDQMVHTGAKDTILKDGDKVVFTYAKF